MGVVFDEAVKELAELGWQGFPGDQPPGTRDAVTAAGVGAAPPLEVAREDQAAAGMAP